MKCIGGPKLSNIELVETQNAFEQPPRHTSDHSNEIFNNIRED